ncbi:MAG: hypothetical protein SGI88_04040 [Candidatus Hydrogenedentes bacterium]|nr:hypothetical protein [Candidatus Hydrogenedentota bacterium]
MWKFKVFAGLAVLLLAIGFTVAPALAGSTWVKTRIGLKATDNELLASGKVVYREKDLGFRRKFSLEVEDVLSTPDVEVFVDNVSFGVIPLVAGGGEMELDTRDGDSVPLIIVGSKIQIRSEPDDEVLLKGRNN